MLQMDQRMRQLQQEMHQQQQEMLQQMRQQSANQEQQQLPSAGKQPESRSVHFGIKVHPFGVLNSPSEWMANNCPSEESDYEDFDDLPALIPEEDDRSYEGDRGRSRYRSSGCKYRL